jgi:hypothetical protein
MNLSSDQSSSIVLPTVIDNIDCEEKSISIDDDNDEKKYVYLKHVSNSKIWKVSFTAAKHAKLIRDTIINNDDDDLYGRVQSSPLIINQVKYNTIEFMITYMNYYDGKKEKCSPTLPLKNIDISYILEDEYELFTNLCDDELNMKEKLFIYDEYIRSANYFGFEYLHKKLCAIVANMFKDLTLSELQQLAST